MGQRTMARILQENSRAGQRLCLKGATWVGTVTAPNDKEVQAGHQGHTGNASRTLVIHLQTALLWVRLHVQGLKEPHYCLPSQLGDLDTQSSSVEGCPAHNQSSRLPNSMALTPRCCPGSSVRGTAPGAPPPPLLPLEQSIAERLLICGCG